MIDAEPATAAPPIPDGRHARKTVSKSKLVRGALSLIQAGNFRPTVVQIVAAAGLSPRTFFGFYPTVESFFEELISEYHSALMAAVTATIPDLTVSSQERLLRILLLGRL
jgi:AcrR family transcriptional regulator